ncbi:MAG TPA: carboxypeptidase-like regulatory domain-containing protein [Lacibacter sp.]|nr:carboxypeptidase-like regulatory domain-containing protein [Lacibacter sp.]
MRYTLLLICLLCGYLATAQTSYFVKGTVTDDSSGQILDGATVLCQNTTRGTITNKEGVFQLEVPMGGHNLVISYAGYESESMRISPGQDGLSTLQIRLKKKEKNLQEVVVQASLEVKDGWNKYGGQFRDYFIGTTPFARQCTIENPEVLKFYFLKKRNRLRVKAEEPLVVMNYALGYKIQYQLDSFIFDYGTNFSGYVGVAFYTELDSTQEQEIAWKKNRELAYAGSRLHFMRCYYDSTLAENGFVLEEVRQDSARKKTTTVPVANPYDSTIYMQAEGTDKEINLFGFYRVVYQLQPMEPEYLRQNKYPLTAKEQVSTLEFLNGFAVTENGFFYEQTEVINSGYWAWKNLADQLPYDYWPDPPVTVAEEKDLYNNDQR